MGSVTFSLVVEAVFAQRTSQQDHVTAQERGHLGLEMIRRGLGQSWMLLSIWWGKGMFACECLGINPLGPTRRIRSSSNLDGCLRNLLPEKMR